MMTGSGKASSATASTPAATSCGASVCAPAPMTRHGRLPKRNASSGAAATKGDGLSSSSPGPSPMAQNQSPRRLSMAATTVRPRGLACASNTRVVARPASGTPSPTARPRAAARPTRTPVKLPGPMVTAISDSSRRPTPASPRAAAMAGSSRAAWSRPSSAIPASRVPSPTMAIARPLTAQSNARTRLMSAGSWSMGSDRRDDRRWRRPGRLGILRT